MDLLEFDQAELYFERPESPEVAALLSVASADYGSPQAAQALLAAEKLAPESLTVLVAVFRYHYYQHNLELARQAGFRAARRVAQTLGFQSELAPSAEEFARAFEQQPGAARFYLQALKGIGYLSLRLALYEDANALLQRVVDFDTADRLGCRVLLDLLDLERKYTPRQERAL